MFDPGTLHAANTWHPLPGVTTGHEPQLASHWYLAYSKPRQEQQAVQQLVNQGYSAYAPLCPVRRKPGQARPANGVVAVEPMFPRYVFLRPGRPAQGLAPVRNTRGISCLVSFGAGPVVVPPQVIEEVKAAEQLARQQNPLGLETLAVGSTVRMADGRLNALQGLVTAVAGDRVSLLLNILGRDHTVTVRHEDVQPC
ncbi:MAG: transcription termination/antitermination NusG family protein [Hydrogenophaga sp.]